MALKHNKILLSCIMALGVAIIFTALSLCNVLELWQNRLSDNLYKNHISPSNDIVIVGIDDKTISALNSFGMPCCWDRSIYAKVISNLGKYDPKIIAIDSIFAGERTKEGDQQFAGSFKQAKTVILAYLDSPIIDNTKNSFTRAPNSSVSKPYSALTDQSNVSLAFVNIPVEKNDVTIRRYVTSITDQATGEEHDSFALAIVRSFLGNEETNMILKNIPFEKGMLINYLSKSDVDSGGTKQTFDQVPFIDLYNDHFVNFDPAVKFKNKIVIIGPFSDYFKDNFFTPKDSKYLMYGVEIHANAIQTILEQKFLRNMTQTEKIFLIVFLSLLSVFVFMFTRIRWSVIYLFAVPTAYALLAQPIFDRGIIVDLVHPFLVIATSFIAVYVYRYLTEFKEKLALKSAFSKYVNPQLASEIAEHPEKLKLGGENGVVTVLFTDIAHFTSISEKLTAESLVSLMNEYFTAMTDVIQAEGGTVDKYEGDAIMAFFGAPLAQADHAVKACNAALKMRIRLDDLLKKWKSDSPLPGGEKKPAIDFRCGINTGEVIIGNVGSKSRMEYTIIGDDVNLGSRLEGQNKEYDTRIMISEFTYEKVKDKFECREIDLIKVVGKNKPVKIYELLNFKGRLVPEAADLLKLYEEGISLYQMRKYADGLAKFDEILKRYPSDGPSKTYRQRCEVFRDFPPAPNWDGVFEKRSK